VGRDYGYMGTTADTLKYDTTECTRCGGSGRYSFNMRDGDTCWGCGGTGKQRTAKGEQQRDLYLAALETPVEDVQVGWKVFAARSGGGNAWQRVTEIRRGTLDDGGTLIADPTIDPSDPAYRFSFGEARRLVPAKWIITLGTHRWHTDQDTIRANRGYTTEQLNELKRQVWEAAGLL